ncbi:putative E3 ubiquitin-protein ligase LIN-1 [Heracleum sosnowskyi]|uniref:E3 ubiquitin-protein ligase LIN-1 n=1 Tax=Heracleum sosnowskyi TaxID=360622 RepID=A0AAD8MW68_9APIA|nr:putative E3 ubiquitin-protein ligase LIN-1 [Heracleum sosnowskyi]
MSHTSVASTSYSSSSSSFILPHNHQKLDLKTIQLLVSKINQYLDEFIVDDKARKNVKHKCSSRLKTGKQEFFEFSEQSIISNLYWGIESIEAAIQAKNNAEEKVARLQNAEKMLQVPALLSEHGVTAEIPNYYLVCSSYFYLSLVRKLQNDEWQVAIHFLQALMVSPVLVYKEFAPKLCTNIFESCIVSERQEVNTRRKSGAMNHFNSGQGEVGEGLRLIAKQYKGWLMYYQVMFYGDASRSRRVSAALPDDNKSENLLNMKSITESQHPPERECSQQAYSSFEKVHPLDPVENVSVASAAEESKVSTYLRNLLVDDRNRTSDIRCLRDILKESQSNTPLSSSSRRSDFIDEDDFKEYAEDSEASFGMERIVAVNPEEISNQKRQSPSSSMRRWDALIRKEDITIFGSRTFSSSLRDLNLSQLEAGLSESHTFLNCHMEEETSHRRIQLQEFAQSDSIGSATLQNYYRSEEYIPGSSARRKKRFSSENNIDEIFLHPEENSHIEQVGVLEKLISKLCFSEDLGEEDYTVEITTVYEILNKKAGAKYSMLKDIIIDQLLMAISTSKEEGVIRTSVSILSTIISVNKSVVEDIKKKGLRLSDLVTALKRNVYEAATLIYFVNPSPAEINNLELLPVLLEVICSSNSQKCSLSSPKVTPPAASLMIIEVLITACDYATNNMHLEAISSPRVLCGLLNAPKQENLQEFISLAAVLVRCMRFDGKCRKQISQFTPIAPVISLLLSKHKPAIYAGLEFLNEILRIPRTSAISLLQQVEKEGRTNDIRDSLLHAIQSQPEHKLLAANLLLHLEMLEDSSDTSIYCKEAMEIILEALVCDDNPATQNSAFILSNLGGTYAWTGEPYTVAWLVKKAGLVSLHHKNIIRNIDWSDQSIQDAGTDTWSNKIARHIIRFGKPVFHALEKGLQSKSKRIAQECLTTIAWLGCELVKTPNDLRYSASEILLGSIEQYVHPGLELEERLLACLCIYNYASGRAMQKLVHFSEGVRESLRRLSSITWMAEELLKVADYLQPDKWRISCVHTQVLEMGNNCSGAVTALIYFRGELYSGYADGSIKAWDVKGQSATLVRDIKVHKKAVTCFSLLEPHNCLLTGSADKTIRIWQMVEQKLECIQVIAAKSSVQSIDTSGNMIFIITQSNNMKVFDASKKDKDVYKKKNVKCVYAKEGKYYLGCLDSSIQEVTLINNRHQELKAPIWSWRIQRKSINSIAIYKDLLYSASSIVEGSSIKEWRRNSKPQMSIVPGKSTTITAMRVVEDFIYLQCSSSMNSLQIWLRGTQHKVGRLSAGSKITSLLTANDMVLCGTETGLIKGWIPL